jgi:hypothetical protein
VAFEANNGHGAIFLWHLVINEEKTVFHDVNRVSLNQFGVFMALTIPSRRCMPPPTISKATVKAMFRDSTTGEWLDKLAENQWKIVSFEPQTRLVCIDVYVNHGVNHMNLTLPVLSVSSLK